MNDNKASAKACAAIDRLRNKFDNELAKELIADSMSTIAELIYIQRDVQTITLSTWTDDLLKVLYTLGEYNSLVNALAETSDRKP